MARERGNLFFCLGCPRSGKSTFADKWVKHPAYRPRVIVCSDDIRLALHGQRYKREAEPMVWAINGYMAEALLARGHDVLIDGTNTTDSSIERLLQIDIDARPFLIDTPKEECLRRAVETEQGDLLPVIERVHAQLEALKEYGIERKIAEIREKVRQRRG